MTLRTRRIFFWSLIPCFVIGGAVAVLYSQGYRVDAATREVTKVGALYVRGYPRDARITLDGEALNTGSWWPLRNGTLDGSLAPGSYRLRAEAPGHRAWDADVVIRPSLVTERKSLILFPEAAATATTPTSFVPTAVAVASGLPYPVLVDSGESPRVAVGGAVLPGAYVGAIDGTLALVSRVPRGKEAAQLLTLRTPGSSAAITVSLPDGTGEAPSVQNDSILYRVSDRLVYAYDDEGDRSAFASSSPGIAIGSYLRTASYDAWELDDGTSTTLAIRRRGTDNVVRVSLPEIVSIQPAGASLGVLDASGSLWLVNPGLGTVREVGHRSRLALWKEDGSAVASVTDGDIVEVIALEQDAPRGRLGAFPGARALAWYPDGEHLFIETTDSLSFADVIDGSNAEQHAYRLPLPRGWAYDGGEDELHVIRDGTAQTFAFPE